MHVFSWYYFMMPFDNYLVRIVYMHEVFHHYVLQQDA
jgi:hypothetical protein